MNNTILKKAALFLAIAPPFMGLTGGRINALLMVAGFIILLFNGSIKFRKGYAIWVGLFSGWCLLSYLWADYTQTILSTTLAYVQVCVMMLVIENGCGKSFELVDFSMKSMIFGAAVYSAKLFATTPFRTLLNGGRMGVGNSLAIRLMILVVIIFMNRKKFQTKVIPYGAMALFTFISMLQGSKKGIIILLMGITMTLLLEAKERRSFLRYVKIVVGVAVLVVVLYLVCTKTPLYSSIGVRIEKMLRLITGKGTVDRSTADRNALIKEAIQLWRNHPFIGIGQDNFQYVNHVKDGYYSHNNFVELLVNLGLVGFVIYYSFFVKHLRDFIKLLQKEKKGWLAIPVVLMTVLIVIDYLHVSYSSECVYCFFGYAFAYYNASKYYLFKKRKERRAS